MKRIIFVFLLTVLVLCNILPVSVLSSNNNGSILVLVDGKSVNFDVEPMIINGRVIVPLRAIFEALGADVEWDDKTKTVIATQEAKVISLKVGSTTAYINNESMELDVPAVVYNGRTLVPVRFISESFGYDVEWKDSSRTVTINCTSQNTIPNSTVAPTLTNTPTSIKLASSFNGNVNELMGLSCNDITGIFGQPDRIDLSKYGFDWYIYNSDYNKYIQIGVRDEVVVGVYTNSTYFSAWGSIKVLADKNSVNSILGTPLTYIKKGNVRYITDDSGEEEIFEVDEEYFATIFYDTQNSNKVSAVLLVDRKEEMALNGYYGIPSEKLRQSYEREIFDLANSVRTRLGKKIFKWDDKAASVARMHSEDMALNNYFSHTNLEGKSPFDRMDDAGLNYYIASENIAMGQMSGIYAHESWMNSSGHRSNILGDCEKLGVGVYIGSGNNIFYTQNFYSGY
ncbi:stalk domain-containing protein [Acetivibrio cellulolyticus]|uniref:stalk domain-containing protein n=1 Tax=Acetivibrio cellulolyticus TaxID=35830 RepID=UPI0002481C04|nr:stalk domain-containing protein [Acetivibrio cellulolyticus]